MQKKVLSLIFVLCLLLGLFPLAMGTAAADSSAAYTEIGTAEALIDLMGDSSKWTGNYRLTATIDLTGKAGQTPIGTSSTPFTGIFDGAGYTIKGISLIDTSTATSANANWALFGYVQGGEIRNLIISGEVSTTGRRGGGLVGAINLSATIENCTNNCSVSAYANAGGVVAFASPVNGATITGCVNNGAVTTGAADGAAYVATTGTGGILGSTNKLGTCTVSGCANYGAVTGIRSVGGIVGYYYGADTASTIALTSATYKLYDCLNAGTVTATSATQTDLGGILGIAYQVAGIHSCWNKGDVVISAASCSKPYAGGICGRTQTVGKMAYCYNEVKPTYAGTSKYAQAIVGYPAVKNCISNYYKDGLGMTDQQTTQNTAYSAENFNTLNAKGHWISTADGAPELFSFHTHVYNKHEAIEGTETHTNACSVEGCTEALEASTHTYGEDSLCTVCGASDPSACAHTETYPVIKTVPTCVTTGVKETICSACGEVLKTETLAVDESNHTAWGVWTAAADGKYTLACTDCGAIAATLDVPVVYLDAGTTMNEAIGADTNDGLTAATAVLTLDEAVRRLAATGGKVILADRYTFAINEALPAYTGTITFTTENCETGFRNDTALNVFTLGGPTKFENLIFNGVQTVIIVGNWNDVAFEKLSTFGTAWFVAGNHLPDAGNDEEKNVTLTFDSTVSRDSKTFFDRIHLGTRGMTTSFTVANKTVTANITDTAVGSLYTGTTSNSTADAQMTNVHVTLNLNGDATIGTIRNGDGNTHASAGTAYLDSLTLNLNDTSTIPAFALRNVRKVELNLSTGRTTDTMLKSTATYPLHKGIALTGVYLASENHDASKESITVNYGSHGYDRALTEPDFASYASVTLNVTDECTWNEGEVTTAPGVGTVGEKTYTCTVCGATKTEEVAALKAALAQKSISAATDKVSGESTMRFIAALEVADGVTVEKIGTYISLVALGEDGTPSTEGARVAVKEQAVTDAAPATFAVDLTGIPADQAGTSVFAWAYAVLSDGTRVTVAFDAATVNALVSVQ